MKLVMAADYSGFKLKEAVREFLTAKGYEILDVGQTRADEKAPYLDGLTKLVKEIQEGRYERGMLFCGTGAGMCIVANKYKGVYCVVCESVYTASRCAMINGANVISMGGNVVGPDNACQMAEAWLTHSFLQGFDEDRRRWLGELDVRMKKLEETLF